MQLDKFEAVAKPRTDWQAVDLGMNMARRWYPKLILLWLIPTLPLFIALLYLFSASPLIAALTVWWLKPLWEKPLLYVVSRELFGEEVSVLTTLRKYWSIIKTDLLMSVTFRRFSPSRSYTAPVSVLEGLKGKKRNSRTSLLGRRFSNGATWALIIGVHIEMFLALGFIALIFLLLPQNIEVDWFDSMEQNQRVIEYIYYGIWMVCAAIVAPFYVCSGFALYIQRRIDLEAWDIEIQFKRLAQRRASIKKRSAGQLVLLCLISSLCLLNTKPSVAEEDQIEEHTLSPEQQDVREQIIDVYNGEHFTRVEHRSGWRIIPPEEQEQAAIPEWMINFAEFLERHGGFFEAIGSIFKTSATIIEIGFWVVLITIVVLTVYFNRDLIRRAISGLNTDETEEIEKPSMLFGLDVTEESLPDKICDSALAAWNDGNQREALSLLLRASIVQLMQDHHCEFQDGFTESECAIAVRQTLDSNFDHCFSTLVKQWQLIAYAHAQDIALPFEDLVGIWRGVFNDA